MTNRSTQSRSTSGGSSTKSRKSEAGKDPVRVQAGKKAAETRGRESLREAGKKGGEHSQGGRGKANK